MTSDDARAGLIMRALGARRLHGFLPGQDNRAAVADAVASCPAWIHGGMRGRVTRNGLGEWPAGARAGTRGNAVVYVTWREVLEIAAQGCPDGCGTAYLAAWQAYESRARKVGPDDADPAAVTEAAWQLVRRGLVKPARAQATMQRLF